MLEPFYNFVCVTIDRSKITILISRNSQTRILGPLLSGQRLNDFSFQNSWIDISDIGK